MRKVEERTRLIDLGWAVVRLRECKGTLDEDGQVETWNADKPEAAWHTESITFFSPADEVCPAQSIYISGAANVKKLADFLAPLTTIFKDL